MWIQPNNSVRLLLKKIMYRLLVQGLGGALLWRAVAGEAAAAGDHDDTEACTLYMAPSSLSDGGWGVYTAVERQPGDQLESSDDVCLPFIDVEWHHPDFHHPYREFYWDGRAKGMSAESQTGHVEAFCPGVHSMVNCQAELANIQFGEPIYDEAGLHRSQHTVAGTRSPYGIGAMTVTRHIPAGGEVFGFYGKDWAPVSTMDSAETQSFLLEISSLVHTEGVTSKELRRKLVESKNVDVDLLPETMRKCLSPAEPDIKHTQTVAWLKENGRCIDSLVKGPSTIQNSGTGAFARRDVKEGQIVATSPLHHFVDNTFMKIYNITKEKSFWMYEDESDAEYVYARRLDQVHTSQIAHTYCFGSWQTTLLLCPYGPTVNYIQRSDEPNVQIRWASGISEHDPESIHDLSLNSLAGMPPTLAFEYVALRDMAAGEEFFLDYGSDWVEDWSEYETNLIKNIMPKRPKMYMTARHMNNRFAQALIPTTEEEGQYLRTPDHIQIRCHSDVPQGYSPSNYEWKSVDYGLPCVVIDRFVENGDILYTVYVEVEMNSKKDDVDTVDTVVHRLRTDLPRHALRFFDVPGSSDLYLEKTFREPIGVPEDVLPKQWINVQDY